MSSAVGGSCMVYGGSGAPDIQAADHATGDDRDRDVLGVSRHQSG